MGSGHAHVRGDAEVSVAGPARVLVLGVLAAVGLATVIGLWQLWPDASKAPHLPASAAFSGPGVSVTHVSVTAVQPACPSGGSGAVSASSCGHITVALPGPGRSTAVAIPPPVSHSGLRAGDRVAVVRAETGHGQPVTYTYLSTDRHVSLFWLLAIFVVVVLVVARLRGLMALLALGFSALMITRFMLPALLQGEAGLWTAVVGSSAIMFVVLYLTHGPSLRTSCALTGTLVGIGVSGGVGTWAIHAGRLSGVADESGGSLSTFLPHLSFPGLLMCGLILAGLGVLNDVTITQSSAVWELRSAGPHLSRRQIFTRAMRIGRDHISSTIYTLVFAYAGASIVVLLLVVVYDRPVFDLLSSEDIAEEIVRTLASGIGLVLAVPVTTAIAALVASPSAGGVRRGARRRVAA